MNTYKDSSELLAVWLPATVTKNPDLHLQINNFSFKTLMQVVPRQDVVDA